MLEIKKKILKEKPVCHITGKQRQSKYKKYNRVNKNTTDSLELLGTNVFKTNTARIKSKQECRTEL